MNTHDPISSALAMANAAEHRAQAAERLVADLRRALEVAYYSMKRGDERGSLANEAAIGQAEKTLIKAGWAPQ